VKKMLFVAALATLISVALAQDIRISGQPLHVSTTGNVGRRTAGDVRTPAGLQKIYSNIGTKTAAYDKSGWLILGPNSAFGQEQWIGFPFTPKKNSTATRIKAALGYFDSGANRVTVAIYRDASGVPGKKIVSAEASNLKEWTDPCCDAIKTRPLKATALKAKTQYWVVVRTDEDEMDSEGVWHFVWDDADGNLAYSFDGGVTWSRERTTASAFGVFGTIP